MPPLSLYVHFPWCITKCPYCDFNSHQIKHEFFTNNAVQTGLEDAYVDALISQLKDHKHLAHSKIKSIFIGGGTPSLISIDALDKLFNAIHKELNLESNAEITIEVNPSSFERNKFIDYKKLGINRLSIGAQTFNDAHLKILGRVHDGKQAILAIEQAHKVGYENFNVDLMFNLPTQSRQELVADLKTLLSLSPQHISYYELTLEPNSAFYKNPPKNLPNEDEAFDNMICAYEILEKAGFQKYEISAFSKKDKWLPSIHNFNYWQFGDYLGIGAGAASKISFETQKDFSCTRLMMQKSPNSYIREVQDKNYKFKDVKREDLIFEFLLNALRLEAGFSSDLFTARTKLPAIELMQALHKFIDKGWIIYENGNFSLSAQAYFFRNEILQDFV